MPRHTHKYHALAGYLAAQPGDQVVVTFAQIEALVGAPLPASALRRAWWSNHTTTST